MEKKDNHISRMTEDRTVRIVRNNIPREEVVQKGPRSAGQTLSFKKQAISLAEGKKRNWGTLLPRIDVKNGVTLGFVLE
jgi:hypothetical protein